MKNYFVLDELEEEMRDAKMFSRRFDKFSVSHCGI